MLTVQLPKRKIKQLLNFLKFPSSLWFSIKKGNWSSGISPITCEKTSFSLRVRLSHRLRVRLRVGLWLTYSSGLGPALRSGWEQGSAKGRVFLGRFRPVAEPWVRVGWPRKKMKFEAKKLLFCTWGEVGRADSKIEKKIRKIWRLRKMPNFDISGTYPSNFLKSCQDT